MEKTKRVLKVLGRVLSYVLVAVIASGIVLYAYANGQGTSKLDQLETLIDAVFIADVDQTAIEDAAADAMVNALGDRWSYYIPASEYEALMEQKSNSYVGVGITITVREDETGFDIIQVEPGGPAQSAGILPGDILVEAEGQDVMSLGMDGARDLIRGKAGTAVSITILRDGERMPFELIRSQIQVEVAAAQMLDDQIGLITIANFNENCAAETKAAVEELLEQGAQALIFDVRNNPGGYKSELVALLDYLLPEGPLFRSLDYAGRESVDTSDKSCVEIPMAVLVNGNSYSAAEFFAAALEEYDWAVVVGDPTCGKGYFQYTYQLNDGSGVGLSVGKYFTPNGVSLADEGGLVPEILVEVDEQTAAMIYADALEPEEDPQLQAAVQALLANE